MVIKNILLAMILITATIHASQFSQEDLALIKNNVITQEIVPALKQIVDQVNSWDVHAQQMIKALEETGDINFQNHYNYGPSALMVAAYAGDVELMQRLIFYGANVNATAYAEGDLFAGKCVLAYALDSRNPEALDILLHNGARVNVLVSGGLFFSGDDDVENNPLLTYAISRQHSCAIIEKLIEAGTDVNATDCENKWTPLWLAATLSEKSIIQALLERQATIPLTIRSEAKAHPESFCLATIINVVSRQK